MNRNKKNRPDAGTSERATEKVTLVGASIFTNNCTSFNCNGQAKIALMRHRAYEILRIVTAIETAAQQTTPAGW